MPIFSGTKTCWEKSSACPCTDLCSAVCDEFWYSDGTGTGQQLRTGHHGGLCSSGEECDSFAYMPVQVLGMHSPHLLLGITRAGKRSAYAPEFEKICTTDYFVLCVCIVGQRDFAKPLMLIFVQQRRNGDPCRRSASIFAWSVFSVLVSDGCFTVWAVPCGQTSSMSVSSHRYFTGKWGCACLSAVRLLLGWSESGYRIPVGWMILADQRDCSTTGRKGWF